MMSMVLAVVLSVATLQPAAEVLRAGEVSGDKVVAQGDGMLVQVPASFHASERKGAAVAVSGTFAGMLGPVTGVIWLTRAPFKGKVAKLIGDVKASAAKAGGRVDQELEAKAFDRSGFKVAAYQITIIQQGKRVTSRYAIVNKVVYGAHCEIPGDDQSFASAGSDCALAVGTLHIGPAK